MPTIIVTGATGQQGGAVVKALLKSGTSNLTIRALTRNPNSAAAQALVDRGVVLAKGDLFNRSSLVLSLTGCDAAYLVTDFRNPDDIGGIKHVVFSSVAGANAAKSVEHFYSNYQIEEMLYSSSLSWTIIHPVGFLEVIPPPGVARFFFISAMAALFGSSMQKWIACDDIGKAVGKELLQPDNLRGKIITIAGQAASIDEVQAALDRGSGTQSWKLWMPRWLALSLSPYHYKQMFEWLSQGIQEGDVNETRIIVPEVMDIETWARNKKGE